MYKIRKDNQPLVDRETLFEAKQVAILENVRNPKSLIEVLDDNDNVVFEKGEKEEPTQEQKENAKDTMIRDLITKCYNMINDCESIRVTLNAEQIDEPNDITYDILSEMVDNFNLHIGQLTSCLSDYQEIEG